MIFFRKASPDLWPKQEPFWQDEILGDTIYHYYGARVVRSITSNGQIVIVKVKMKTRDQSREKAVTDYVYQNHAVKWPRILCTYSVKSTHGTLKAMVMTHIPGQTLQEAWPVLSNSQRRSLKMDLKRHLQGMRTFTQPYIWQIGQKPVRNFHDQIPHAQDRYIGPFNSKQEWDDWCLERVRKMHGEKAYNKWKKRLMKMDEDKVASAGDFVLTHADLSPSNIMVHDGVVTGIVDWESYIERITLTASSKNKEKCWRDVVEEILPCSKDRLKFHKLVMDRGY